jgi:simple sugar transport system ATP-binding protein
MGRTVAEVLPSEVTARDLAELMVGSELPKPDTRESTVTDRPALKISNLIVKDDDGRVLVDDVSFTIHEGEILGVAGVEGNGQTELIEAIMGIQPLAGGTVVLGGTDLARVGTRERRERGLGYIPQDRQRDGLVLTAPLWENAALGHQTSAPFARGGWIDRKGAVRQTREIIEEFDVRTPGPEVAALALSGGNQQKLVVGREMMAEPKVLIAAHPTRGIDVGAQADIWDDLRKARAAGLAVLLVSADLEELIGLSDTLVVFLRGRLVATLDPSTVTPVDLGSYMTGAREEQGAA